MEGYANSFGGGRKGVLAAGGWGGGVRGEDEEGFLASLGMTELVDVGSAKKKQIPRCACLPQAGSG